jgi:hypothetical protein
MCLFLRFYQKDAGNIAILSESSTSCCRSFKPVQTYTAMYIPQGYCLQVTAAQAAYTASVSRAVFSQVKRFAQAAKKTDPGLRARRSTLRRGFGNPCNPTWNQGEM